MIQALVFLPLIGALIAGFIAILGAHARNPSGDDMDHAHGHGDHAHGDLSHGHAAVAHSTTPINADASVIHETHSEPGHDDHGHDDHGHDDHHVAEPAAAGSRAAELITAGLLVVSAALAWITFVDVAFHEHNLRVVLLNWINSGDLQLSWALRVDTLTAVMLVVVTTV